MLGIRADRAALEVPAQEVPSGAPVIRWPLSLVILAASLTVGATLRLWLAFNDDGLHWPDEIYQSLEPAHRAAFGYGLLAWEFIDGARNWTFPGLIAGVIKLAGLAGIDSPRLYLRLVRIIFCAVGIGTALAIFRLARACGAGKLAASCGCACFCLMNVAIYFAPRGMSETAAALAVTAGLALSLPREASRSQLWLGTSILSLAVLLRLQCALFCIGLLGVLLLRRARRPLVDALIVFAFGAFVFGLIDRLTWGHWFHSASAYLRFNLLERGAEIFGRSPPSYYPFVLVKALGPLGVVIAGFAVLAIVRARELFGIALLFFIPHWLSAHKELRFLFPLIPLWCALAAVGLQLALDSRARWLRAGAPALVLGAAAYSAGTLRQLTFHKLGVSDAHVSAFDAGGPENRLLLAAHDAADLCGLKILTRDLDYVGGYAYLHRRVPLYGPAGPANATRFFNYVIAARGSVVGRVLSEDSGLVLARIFDGGCEPNRSYNWHLN